MSFTVSDLIVETLEACRRAPGVRPPRRLAERFHRRAAPQRNPGVEARASRGGRRVRGGGRSRDHRRAGRVRGELRTGQPAPDQRALRRPPVPGAGAGDRRAHPDEEIGRRTSRRRIPQELFRECSVYCELVADTGTAPARARHRDPHRGRAAWRRGAGRTRRRPGRRDARGPGDHDDPLDRVASFARATRELRAAARVLNGAERVTILAGRGCAGAHEQVVALAEALQAPIVHTLRGKEFVEYDNPYDVGMTGLLGFDVGLPRDERVRRAPDARHRLPVSRLLSRTRDRDPGRRAR